MKINRISPLRGYRTSPIQEEALIARTTHDSREQIRIAKNSGERLVLMNLAMNKSLHKDTVQELYSRDRKDVTRRLDSLGYKKEWF